jgi:hypothetical protein
MLPAGIDRRPFPCPAPEHVRNAAASSIAKAIIAIAFRTNLIALNTAVEAARAGTAAPTITVTVSEF